MKYTYTPRGVCSRRMTVELDDAHVIEKVTVEGGCSGNLQGIAQLAKGRPVAEIIELLKGIKCGAKASSCPEQLALGLEKILAEEK